MNSRQTSPTRNGSYRDSNALLPSKYQRTSNKQYYTNIHKPTESVDNSGSIKVVTNAGVGGINSLLKSTNESNDNINRTTKKLSRVQSIHRHSQMRGGLFINLSDLIDQSIKQIEEYRFKIKNSLNEQISNQLNETNAIKNNSLLKFPQRPKIPDELIGKSNEKNLTNLIIDSNIDKSDEMNTLTGRYEVTNIMNPTNDFHFNEKINKLNETLSLNIFEYFEEYSKYLNRLLNQYFTDENIYENAKSKSIVYHYPNK